VRADPNFKKLGKCRILKNPEGFSDFEIYPILGFEKISTIPNYKAETVYEDMLIISICR
jgi:hypothetical protein